MSIVFIVGVAGSGKSLLTATFSNWLKMQNQNAITVNLDPGVLNLPYTPDVDICDYINIKNIMEEYNLGPNGALIVAADLIAEEIEKIGAEIEALNPDVTLVDTPGQMELFAFRASGPYIANEISKGPKAIIHLFDTVFCLDPLNYVSCLFLSAAVYNRFLIPQVHALSKCDLLPKEDVNRIVDWSAKSKTLESAIERKLNGEKRLLSRNVMKALYSLGFQFPLIPISSKTNEGLVNLNIALERVLARGEKYTY